MKTGFASWMLIGVLASSAHAFDVTGCGQLVPAGQVGVLQADLDCSATSGNCFDDPARGCARDPGCTDAQCPGVVVRKDATLQMNGHTVANGVVLCADSCAVVGPGTVVGGFGVASMKNLTVSGGLDVHDGAIGIAATRNAIVSDATVTGVAHNWAIWGNWNLRVANVTANGNGNRGSCHRKRRNAPYSRAARVVSSRRARPASQAGRARRSHYFVNLKRATCVVPLSSSRSSS